MEQCGYRCAWKGVAEKIKKARKKSSTMDEFWDNLQALYPRHVPLERAKEGTPPISMGGLLPTEVGSVHLLAKWFSTG